MPDRPLLVLPQPAPVEKARRFGGPPNLHLPSRGRQAARITPQLTRLQAEFANRQVTLAASPGSLPAELLLVFETAGPVTDFFRAVARIPGLQWQLEWEDEFSPDEDFFTEGDLTKPLNGFAYLMLGSHEAMQNMLRLWQMWQAGAPLPNGYAPWREAFQQLRAIRPWDERDRIRSTGFLEYTAEELAIGREIVVCEAELTFRDASDARVHAEERVRTYITAAGGQTLSSYQHAGIRYHALLFELPVAAVEGMRELREDIQLLKADDIFVFRPAGQSLQPIMQEAVELSDSRSPVASPPLLTKPPVAALLDGMPMQNHARLSGRLIVVNPEEEYAAQHRIHGTQMASAIIHGDLANGEPAISRPLVARPIMVLDVGHQNAEAVPRNRLIIDLVQEAIRDLVAGEAPAAPTVRLINFAIADRFAQFDRTISPWARMLDWLAYTHNLLFIVSAGNHGQTLITNLQWKQWAALSPAQKQDAVLQAVAADARNRRLRPPSESVNGLTVGAIADDGSQPGYLGAGFLPFVSRSLPAPYSATGLGLRRMIKPDIFVSGGRSPIREEIPRSGPNAAFELMHSYKRSAGIQVAMPGNDGEIDREVFDRGTSHATALATRSAILAWDVLEDLRDQRSGEFDEAYFPVLLKAMLVHGASWRNSRDDLRRAFGNALTEEAFRKHVQRFFGFGNPDFSRCIDCTERRATLLGFGKLGPEQAHEFYVPLPPSLSGQAGVRRVTVTLAYFSPISARNQKYAAANLWFVFGNTGTEGGKLLDVARTDCDNKAVQRGTVQHEIFEGNRATVFGSSENLRVQVNSAADAAGFDEAVRYGLAVSIEVAETVPVQVYQEVSARIQTLIGVRA